jgi:hypothetical protein
VSAITGTHRDFTAPLDFSKDGPGGVRVICSRPDQDDRKLSASRKDRGNDTAFTDQLGNFSRSPLVGSVTSSILINAVATGQICTAKSQNAGRHIRRKKSDQHAASKTQERHPEERTFGPPAGNPPGRNTRSLLDKYSKSLPNQTQSAAATTSRSGEALIAARKNC